MEILYPFCILGVQTVGFSLLQQVHQKRGFVGAGASSKWMGVIASMSLQHHFTGRNVPQREF
jgi:hypothetical protein